jgi:septum formation protein
MARWLATAPLVLASRSESRRNILHHAGIPADIRPADLDERSIEAGAGAKAPDDIAVLLARAKAHAVSAVMPGRLVLGADQTLALGDRRFSKPADRAAARAQLQMLSAKTHSLHSALALACDGNILFDHCACADLTMRAFSVAFLDHYLEAAGDTVLDSVGAYRIEAIGIQLFERIDGDFFTILGLPLMPLLDGLRRIGAVET